MEGNRRWSGAFKDSNYLMKEIILIIHKEEGGAANPPTEDSASFLAPNANQFTQQTRKNHNIRTTFRVVFSIALRASVITHKLPLNHILIHPQEVWEQRHFFFSLQATDPCTTNTKTYYDNFWWYTFWCQQRLFSTVVFALRSSIRFLRLQMRLRQIINFLFSVLLPSFVRSFDEHKCCRYCILLLFIDLYMSYQFNLIFINLSYASFLLTLSRIALNTATQESLVEAASVAVCGSFKQIIILHCIIFVSIYFLLAHAMILCRMLLTQRRALENLFGKEKNASELWSGSDDTSKFHHEISIKWMMM